MDGIPPKRNLDHRAFIPESGLFARVAGLLTSSFRRLPVYTVAKGLNICVYTLRLQLRVQSRSYTEVPFSFHGPMPWTNENQNSNAILHLLFNIDMSSFPHFNQHAKFLSPYSKKSIPRFMNRMIYED